MGTKEDDRGGKRAGSGRPYRYGYSLPRRELRLRAETIAGIKALAKAASIIAGKRVTFAKYVDDLLFNHIQEKTENGK